MAQLFCVICREGIPVNQTRRRVTEDEANPAQNLKPEGAEAVEEPEEDHSMLSTSCGHIFHNSCLRRWFRVEEGRPMRDRPELRVRVRDLNTRVENRTGIGAGERRRTTGQVHFLPGHTCPYCKEIIIAANCIRLFAIEARDEDAVTDSAQVRPSKEEFDKLNAELKELQKKYEGLLQKHNAEVTAYRVELDRVNEVQERTIREHEEEEEKWILAMRLLNSTLVASKKFYLSVFEAMGITVPPVQKPDLLVADLISRVIENREIVVDELIGQMSAGLAGRNIIDTSSDSGTADDAYETADDASVTANEDVIDQGGRRAMKMESERDDEPQIIKEYPVLSGEVKIRANIGDTIIWARDIQNPMAGTIKWIGNLNSVWTAGIEFENPIGMDECLIRRLRNLFECKEGHGRLVPIVELVLRRDFYDLRASWLKQVEMMEESINQRGGVAEDELNVRIGDKIIWPEHSTRQHPLVGTVKWIGKLQLNSTWLAGIEFEVPIGTDQQLVEKLKSIFPCKEGHGRLVPILKVVRYHDYISEGSSQSLARTVDTKNVDSDSNGPFYSDWHLRFPAKDSSVGCSTHIQEQPQSKKSKRKRSFLRRMITRLTL